MDVMLFLQIRLADHSPDEKLINEQLILLITCWTVTINHPAFFCLLQLSKDQNSGGSALSGLSEVRGDETRLHGVRPSEAWARLRCGCR